METDKKLREYLEKENIPFQIIENTFVVDTKDLNKEQQKYLLNYAGR